eukprot:10531549-Alexandrium_andersonii.AAC.1
MNAATGMVCPGHGVRTDGSPTAWAGSWRCGEINGGFGRREAEGTGAEEAAPELDPTPDAAADERGKLAD